MFDHLPDSLILKIFGNLSVIDVIRASECCRTFNRIAEDDILWRNLFHRNFGVSSTFKQPIGYSTWKEELIRLVDEVPSIETECLTKHTDEVLHVSFSPDGQRFATASKDGFVHVWNTTTYPIESPEFSKDMASELFWGHTIFSSFNKSSTFLLVTGPTNFGRHALSGEIAIFALEDGFPLLKKVKVEPYDIFGTWYSEKYFFSGNNSGLKTNLSSTTEVWLNGVTMTIRGAETDETGIRKKIFTLNNQRVAMVKMIILADYIADEPKSMANEPSTVSGDASPLDKSTLNRSLGYSPMSMSPSVEVGRRDGDKLLIYACGYKSNTPHQIGFNRITSQQLTEAIEGHEVPQNDKGANVNLSEVTAGFDKRDHELDLDGCIVGMTLSPDHRYLYANCRRWPEIYETDDPFESLTISEEVDIHIIDLTTFREVRVIKGVHKAHTTSDYCFLLFLDASDLYLGSGSEDGHGYILDRHYGIPLMKLPHMDVVNCVAFNPIDPQMLVSVSDDFTIKIWRSKSQTRTLGLRFAGQNQGIPLYTNSSSLPVHG